MPLRWRKGGAGALVHVALICVPAAATPLGAHSSPHQV